MYLAPLLIKTKRSQNFFKIELFLKPSLAFVFTLFALYPGDWVYGQEFTLFLKTAEQKVSHAAAQYDQIIDQLKPGDVLVFSNGKRVRVGQKLGHGLTTQVLEIDDQRDKALRIPFPLNGEIPEYVTRGLIDSYKNGSLYLRQFDLDAPEVFENLSLEYDVVQKKVGNQMDLKTFLLAGKSLDPPINNSMRDALLRLASKLAPFNQIGDLHWKNLVYFTDQGQWVVMDFRDDFSLIGPYDLRSGNSTDHPLKDAFDDAYLYKGGEPWLVKLRADFEEQIKINRNMLNRTGRFNDLVQKSIRIQKSFSKNQCVYLPKPNQFRDLFNSDSSW